MYRKVAITGMGCVSAIGSSIDEFINTLDANVQSTYKEKYIVIPDFSYKDERINRVLPRLDKACKLLLKASEEAFANVDLANVDYRRIGIIVGTSFGVINSQEVYLKKLYEKGIGSPLDFQHTANNLLSGIISYKYRIKGLNFTIMSGWTSGIDALILANNLIMTNQLDVVIVGGVDVLPLYIDNFYMNSESSEFIEEKFLPGEGCGVIILEAYDNVLNKKNIQGSIIDFGQGNYYNIEEIEDDLSNILYGKSNVNYFTNLNKTKIDFYELKVLNKMKIDKIIDVKSLIGECGAASAILQLIYSKKNTKQSSIIFSACYLGQYSYLELIMSD